MRKYNLFISFKYSPRLNILKIRIMNLDEVSSFEYGISLCLVNECVSTEIRSTRFNTTSLVCMLHSYMNYDIFRPVMLPIFRSFIYLYNNM
jgi:hypothetical protein